MPARTVAFNDSEPSGRGVPRAAVTLHGPGGPQGNVINFAAVLIDTGAAHTQLPEDIARNIGIDPSAGTPVTISTANGVATRRHLKADLDIQGVRLNQVDVYFGAKASPLVGRSSLYAAFKTAGFDGSEWLREL